jgi:hypothetical protein
VLEKANSIEYRTCTADGLDGWDVLNVVYLHEENGAKQLVGSLFIARHPDGTILRKIDFNKGEKIKDDEHLRGYQKCFDDRDKAAARVSFAPLE